MKFPVLLTITALATLPSCDKVRNLRENLGRKSPAAPATPYAGELVSEINESGFEQLRQQPGRVVVIDFHADWCGPCRKLGPILHNIATEKQGLVLVGKINVDKSPDLAAREGVKGIPDVRIFLDGKQVDRFVGLPAEAEVRRRIESHAKELPPLPPEVANPAKPKTAEPTTQPMSKDWLPPGMQRR